ncbi:putative light regulated Lir1 [Helianthus debilis subsp. tardiflorus]
MKSSVFPAEACEILGGVACDVEMFPETKLKEANTASSKHKVTTTSNSQTLDREYLQYDSPKT